MANSITKFKRYIDLLDEVYTQESKTAILDGDSTLVRMGANANEIIIPKILMDGLADYSRNGGYVKGNVTLTNETVALNYDRGRKFIVDAMDNEETAGVAFGRLSSEFIRTKVVPELDAFCRCDPFGRCGGYFRAARCNQQIRRGRSADGKPRFIHHTYAFGHDSGFGCNKIQRGYHSFFRYCYGSADTFLHGNRFKRRHIDRQGIGRIFQSIGCKRH